MAQQSLLKPLNVSKATVAIIGTAGRRKENEKMSKELFCQMVTKAEEVIAKDFKLELSQVRLVSGGAAWADHVAVRLYLDKKVSALALHLPTKWESSDSHNEPHYHESGSQNDPGFTANTLHKQFSAKLGYNTLEDIERAFKHGAKKHIYKGFKDRNSAVANSNYLVAFTWNDGDVPKKGGTYDTWTKSLGKKLHVSLNSLKTVMYKTSEKCSTTSEKQESSDTDSAYTSGESLDTQSVLDDNNQTNTSENVPDKQEIDSQQLLTSNEQSSEKFPQSSTFSNDLHEHDQERFTGSLPSPTVTSTTEIPQEHLEEPYSEHFSTESNHEAFSQPGSRKRPRQSEHDGCCKSKSLSKKSIQCTSSSSESELEDVSDSDDTYVPGKFSGSTSRRTKRAKRIVTRSQKNSKTRKKWCSLGISS